MVEYLLRTPSSEPFRQAIEEPHADLHIPALADVEVCSAFRRALLGRLVSEPRTAEAVSAYLGLPLSRHGHERLVPRILQLREAFSAYDACYVALAERIGARLLTGDRALARAVEAHGGVDLEIAGP